ncbi:MAG: hypothetical protein ABWY39_02930 [Mycobacterium sp.]
MSTAVAACPGWWGRDVMAHVAAVADDWADGRLSGPPTDEETAAQIARCGYDLAEILAARTDAAARLDRMAETAGVAPRSAASSFMSTTSAVLSVGPAPGIPRRFGIPPTYCSRTSSAGAPAGDGGRCPVSERTRRPSRNTAPHCAIRGPARANVPPQPRPARGHGLVGRPNSSTGSQLHVGPGRRRHRRVAHGAGTIRGDSHEG